MGGGKFVENCDRSPAFRIFSLLRQAGIVAVAASGNEGFENTMAAPACISNVVSVGATTYPDTIAEFSNSSAVLDFLAPGATQQPIGRDKGILSSIPGNLYARIQGTSMAAPHVAGAFAALRSAAPQATIDEIIGALRQTGLAILDPRNGRKNSRIRVDEAVKTLQQMIAARSVEPEGNQEPQIPPAPESTPVPTKLAEPELETDAPPPPKAQPRIESIDGIRIDNGETPIGEDGRIEW